MPRVCRFNFCVLCGCVREVSALKTGTVVEAAEAKALRAMRSHNKSTSAEISTLLKRVAELEERNGSLEWCVRAGDTEILLPRDILRLSFACEICLVPKHI